MRNPCAWDVDGHDALWWAKRLKEAAYNEWEKSAKEDPMYGWLLDRFSMDDFEADPGYQFRLDQGNKALQNAAAATGNLNSGRALKDAIGYNSGMASQEYGNAYNRFNNDQTNQFNRLATITGIGQSSASALAGVGQNYANQVGNNLIGAGTSAQDVAKSRSAGIRYRVKTISGQCQR